VPPLVIAHRGASGTHPENTLVSFRRAVEVGADMIELDVQLTRDHQVVVVHDDTLDRTTDGAGPVAARTLDEVRRLDAGRWFAPAFAGERVPTLAEVLAAIPIPINVELKAATRAGAPDGLEARVLADVEAAAAIGRVVFSSFETVRLERLRALSTPAALAVLQDRGSVAQAIHLAERVAARALHLRKDMATAGALALAAGAGLAVRVWTVNAPAEFARLRDAGVEAVFTDFPERFLQPGRAGQAGQRAVSRRSS
jgi:glycerophosphoryl diester phosphodiesterase